MGEKYAKDTRYLRPDPKAEKGPARASAMDLAWDAMGFTVEDKRYTVVYLDKPTNPKPAEYNERDYGRFGSYFKYELDDGKDLLVQLPHLAARGRDDPAAGRRTECRFRGTDGGEVNT